MKKALNKSLSILLSLAMIIGLFAAAPISANAEITVTYLDADVTLKSAEVVPLASKDLTPGWYAVMSDLTFNDRMSCSGDVHLIMCDGCTLSAKMGITVNKNNSLTIYGQSKGTGHLNATQTGLLNYPAVIGSNGDRDSGLITINGGSINAKNEGLGGAAIGGGSWGFGTVVINGGNIEATTDRGGSSIGGGAGAGGDVTINGGIIYAENKYYNVAIGGGGKQGGAQTVVTINGGEVTAKAASGPAIGTGYDVRCVININGGIVDVTADDYALGSKANDTEINLSWTNSADRIIFSNGGAKGTVTLEKAFTDGTTVYAANAVNPGNLGGKTLMPSPAVQFDVNWDLDDGSYPVSQNLLEGTRPVYSGDIPEKPSSELVGWRDENGNFFESGEPFPAIHAQKTYTATYRVNYIDENGIEQTMLSSAYRDVTSSGASVANWTSGWYVLNQDVDFGSIGVSVSGDVHLVLCDGRTLTVPKGIELKSESAFSIYCQQQGTGALVVTDPDDKTAAIGGDNSSLVKNITINGGVINVTGGTDAPAIGVPPRKNGPVNITINGGTVNATGGAGSTTGRYPFDFSAGIGTYSPSASAAITINGGTVNAAGGAAGDSMGIKGSNITINGGNVTASSQGTGAQNGTDCGIYVNDGGEIRLGWTNKTDSIMSNSYRGTVILEKPFVSNGTVYQAGAADNNAIAAKELTPSYTERNVNIGELSHGTVTVDSVAQVVGNTVKLNVTPDCGYMISNVICGNTQLTPVNGVYSFVMPDTDVTVTAEFVTGDIDLVVGGTAVNRMNFGDILGDGTASYDYDTNTLSLNNAVIEIAKYKRCQSFEYGVV